MTAKFLFLSLFVYLVLDKCGSQSIDEDPNLELVHVNLVWRHGARSPDTHFPSDPNLNYQWNQEGRAQLTQVKKVSVTFSAKYEIGMNMHFDLGKYFKKRYNGFMSGDYKRQEIYVRSSDVERTLMSAECNMAGWYKPRGDQVWNPKIKWQPIPVHTIPLEQDTLIYFPPFRTKDYQKFYQQVKTTDEYISLEETYADFLMELTELTQLPEPLTIENTYFIYDPLKAAEVEGLPLPDWYTKERKSNLFTLASYWFGALFGYKTEFQTAMAKQGPGVIMKQIIDNFDNSIYENATYKAIAYSGHDTTVAGLLVAVDQYVGLPPFAASLFFELYKDHSPSSGGQYVVKAFYRTSSKKTEQLKVLGCSLNCPLEQFRSLFTPIFPDE